MRPRKVGYYLRSLLDLARLLEHRRDIVPLVLGLTREARLKDGLVLRVQDRLDLLVVKETLRDDVYRLAEIADPRLIVDVGAGIGEFAIAAARRFQGCRVLAFEPDPVQFALLSKNVAASGVRVESHRVAVGTRSSYALSGTGARSSTVAASNAEGSSVLGKPLSDFVGLEHVDLLKIDCEGAELDVLESVSRDGFRRVARIALEYHNFDGNQNDALVASHLTDAGFRVTVHPDRYDPSLGYVYASTV